MKRLLFCLGVLCSLLATIGCQGTNQQPPDYGYIDSICVAEIQNTADPMFASVQEVLTFQAGIVEDNSVKEVFLGLPPGVLENVASVCLSKFTGITIRDIVSEYKSNEQIYNNIPATGLSDIPQNNRDTTTVLEGQQLPVPISTSCYYVIDTINGRPVTVLVKEERYESK